MRILILVIMVLFNGCSVVAAPKVMTPASGRLLRQSARAETGPAPTLEDFWDGRAQFVVEVADTGLPVGESDSLLMANGDVFAFAHASFESAGIVDQCGEPVPFPGCAVVYNSRDGGRSFSPPEPAVCLFPCTLCPCDSERDHIDQQQYPRVDSSEELLVLAYEYRGRTMLRLSADGLLWSEPFKIPQTGHWQDAPPFCMGIAEVGAHPYAASADECLIGGPPGMLLEGEKITLFTAFGQNPGGLGCIQGEVGRPPAAFRRCAHSPLLRGSPTYGPPRASGPEANPFFDFRMLSSAEVSKVGRHTYLLYEGIRGPGADDAGDSQFGLGLARTVDSDVDGYWEKYPGNPILVDLPGNVGLGHADLLVLEGRTLLYTSVDGQKRSRLDLRWK